MDATAERDCKRRAKEEDCRNQEKVKLPSCRWGKTLATLLKLCGITDEVFLSQIAILSSTT
jgi:hypothetical protein